MYELYLRVLETGSQEDPLQTDSKNVPLLGRVRHRPLRIPGKGIRYALTCPQTLNLNLTCSADRVQEVEVEEYPDGGPEVLPSILSAPPTGRRKCLLRVITGLGEKQKGYIYTDLSLSLSPPLSQTYMKCIQPLLGSVRPGMGRARLPVPDREAEDQLPTREDGFALAARPPLPRHGELGSCVLLISLLLYQLIPQPVPVLSS